MEHYKLTLNRDLIDPNFSGYKLSLDPLPIYRLSLERDTDVKKILSDEIYSYQHLKAFGLHNHLFSDPFNKNSVWFVDDKWNVQTVTMTTETTLSGPTSAFVIPDAANRRLIPDRVNVTLQFVGRNWAVVADGTGWLYILKTGERSEGGNWKEGYAGEPLGENKHFILLHSISRSDDKLSYVDVLCLHVENNPEKMEKNSATAFLTNIEWLTFSSDNENTFVLSRVRTLQSTSIPDYVALLEQGDSVIVACEKPVKFIFDSLKAVEETKEKKKEDGDAESPLYSWSQNNEEVTLAFKLSSEIKSTDIECHFEAKNLDLKIKGNDLFNGELYGSIKTDDSTWIINDENKLEIHLFKVESEDWSSVVVGDKRGSLILDPLQLSIINEQLAPYISDVMNPDPVNPSKKGFNVQQLEDCDAFPDNLSVIRCIDGETHKIAQEVDISSNQWLFSSLSLEGRLPIACLRHDVDGVVWQPELNECGDALSWRHRSTFNAFGYVQASKQERKFTICAPDFSYVAIVDCTRHVFIYRQPSAILTPLRNRKTGETVGAVAKQQLVSLESVDEILGAVATNERIFVLSGKTVHAVRVNNNNE